MTPDALRERVGEALVRAWLKSDTLPPILFSQAESDALAQAALDATPLAEMREEIERLRGLLKEALPHVEAIEMEGDTDIRDLLLRIDAQLARAALGDGKVVT